MHGPIIVVEDDLEDAQTITSALQDIGVKNNIMTFGSTNEAFQHLLVCAVKPIIILCDIRMGIEDGLTFRRRIQGEPIIRNKSIPFVYLTSLESASIINEAYKLDIQGFFRKPKTYQELKDYLLTIVAYWQRAHHPVEDAKEL